LGKSGQGTDNIVWNLKVLDQRYVYFGVKKTAVQTVTVKNADWSTPEGTIPRQTHLDFQRQSFP
jgi:hypothetical protein